MLIFLAALAGFTLTADLFNLFVFFELMATVAFALTGYRLESSALEGALNFTVTNGIASFLMLAGIGVIYGRTGALNFAQLSDALAGHPADDLVMLAFVLLIGALFVKGAIIPFHFWIADAHAVAPTPVCVIFSGIMVPLVFGAARLYWSIFSGSGLDPALVRAVLVWFGAVTALAGGLVALMQRHVKRLLAFSTVAHMGVLLAAVGLLSAQGLAGGMLYLLGHGLVKGALFMIGGILLSACPGIDEINLRGAGKEPLDHRVCLCCRRAAVGRPAGRSRAPGAGADRRGGRGARLWSFSSGADDRLRIDRRRYSARRRPEIFWDLCPDPGEEADAPSEEERETSDGSVWLMLMPIVVLLAADPLLGLLPVEAAIRQAAATFTGTAPLTNIALDGAAWVAPPSAAPVNEKSMAESILGLCVALVVAALQLARGHFPRPLVTVSDRLSGPVFGLLDRLHNGIVGDYVAWLLFGLVVFGGALAFG